ncbi:MAG: flippase [Pseudomonadota bacterium]
MNLKNRIVANASWLVAERIFRLMVNLFVSAWVARYLGPDGFGALSYGGAVVALFMVFAVCGLQNVVVRELVRHQDDTSRILGSAVVLHTLGAAFGFTLAIIAMGWLALDDTVRLVTAIIALSLLPRFTDVSMYWFEAGMQTNVIAGVRTAAMLIASLLKIGLILTQAELVSFAWAIFIEHLVAAALFLLMYHRHGPGLGQLAPSRYWLRTLAREAWPLLIAGLSVAAYMKVDQLMIGKMMGREAVGVYAAASTLSEICYFIPLAIMTATVPVLVELRQTSRRQYMARYQLVLDALSLLALAIALPVTVMATWIIWLIFGAAFAEASSVLAIHVWTALFVFWGVATNRYLVIEGAQVVVLRRTLVALVINVCANLVLIPLMGVSGAALGLLLSQAYAGLFSDHFDRQTHDFVRLKYGSLRFVRNVRRLRASLLS